MRRALLPPPSCGSLCWGESLCLSPARASSGDGQCNEKELILQNLSWPQCKKEGNYHLLVTTNFTTGTLASVCPLHHSVLSLPSLD